MSKILDAVLSARWLVVVLLTIVFAYCQIMSIRVSETFMAIYGMAIAWYFGKNRPEESPAKKPEDTGGSTVQKLLIVAVLIAGLFAIAPKPVMAENGGIYFKSGALEFTYPLSNLSAISLYDVWRGEGLIGGETQIAKWLRLNLNVGVITSLQANGCGFLSLDYDWADVIPNLPPRFVKLGLWFGRDFQRSENRAGIKAAMPLW